MKIKIKRFDKNLPLPTTEKQAAGFDLFCRENATIAPHSLHLVSVNTAIEIPEGYFLMIVARSSTPWLKGLMIANGAGIIDPYFVGDQSELRIELFNFTDHPVEVNYGDKLAQGVILKQAVVEWEEVESFGVQGRPYETPGFDNT